MYVNSAFVHPVANIYHVSWCFLVVCVCVCVFSLSVFCFMMDMHSLKGNSYHVPDKLNLEFKILHIKLLESRCNIVQSSSGL